MAKLVVTLELFNNQTAAIVKRDLCDRTAVRMNAHGNAETAVEFDLYVACADDFEEADHNEQLFSFMRGFIGYGFKGEFTVSVE